MHRKVSIKKKRITVQFVTDPGKTVLIAGDFNRWYIKDPKSKNARPMKEVEPGVYSVRLFISTGVHEYKFFMDGQWLLDPNAKGKSANGFGGFNSLLDVT